jgi:predicted permease
MLAGLMAGFGQDLRSAARSLYLSPRFTVVAVLTLALGIGVNGAVFSVVNGSMLHVIPWTASGEIVAVTCQKLDKSSEAPASRARYEDWRNQTQSFSSLIAIRGRPFVLTDREVTEAYRGAEVSPEAFAALGLKLALGRGFVAADAGPDAPPQVVLSHGLWLERFGAAPDLVGRTIEIEERQVRVVGVLAKDMWFPAPDVPILAPLRLSELSGPRDAGVLQVLGVLRGGVTLERARLELDTISQRLADQYPETDRGWGTRVRELRELYAGGNRDAALLLLVLAVGAVLLVACVNVANLLLARGIQRQKELAIRCSVGATRARIVAQLLTESTLLALLALPLSLLLARATLDWILSKLPPHVSWMDQVFRFDAPVLLFLAGLSLSTVLFFGLLPALRASRLDLTGVIKEGGDRGSGGPSGGRLRAALTVAQLSAALALLVAASLCIESFNAVMSEDVGFDQERLFIANLRLPVERYAAPEQWSRFQEQLVARIETQAGVEAVGVADIFTATPGGRLLAVTVDGRHPRGAESRNEVRWSALSPGYLKALGLRIVLGRPFGADDGSGSLPVALVNQTLVRSWFNGESPIGDRIVTPDGGAREIVGVVADVKRFGLGAEPVPEVYVPFAQEPTRVMDLLARTSGDPLALAPAFRSEVDALDHLLPVVRTTSVRQALEDALWTLRLFADLMLLLAGLAVALASVGAYGVVSYSVAQRMQEFAIRGALGAEPAQIVTLVLRGALRLVGIGVALGLVLALFAALGLKATTVLVYSVDAVQPGVFGGASLLLAAIILAASAMPAYRSSRAQPSQALRAQ